MEAIWYYLEFKVKIWEDAREAIIDSLTLPEMKILGLKRPPTISNDQQYLKDIVLRFARSIASKANGGKSSGMKKIIN
jgi:hypothetical protein